ncbi:alpha-amylase family glycosyl hydrolase [Colwellia psychrerythraea]|uniref:Cyclomaltodextrin glucanotransferase n=1 Tax=Colwellia psychrerythraea TaxID=28229 RepID=A0A099KSX4_COLPS|nr:alpha-amylase family glycosyl hydrolase [Colwellia psychrerythraea]KGJ93310.1 Cyclomaltodextrin glucanotransferase [Colwellia psychrerythraea]
MNFFSKCTALAAISLACFTSGVSQASEAKLIPKLSEKLTAKAATLAPYQQRDFQEEVFYFVLPDRFYNGDSSNDLGAAANDIKRSVSHGGFDKSHKGMYHGGDLAGLTEKLPYLDNMGVSAIWLTPVLRNRAMQAGTSGYHGYWILDFTEIDPHLGSNAELKNFIEQAHKRNIKVFFDIITNHTADVIKYKECHGEDGLGWIVDGGKNKGNDCPFISMAQLAIGKHYTPLIPTGDETIKFPNWLNDMGVYHNQGDSFWRGESSVRGDFAGLDDLYTQKASVVHGMVDIYKDIIDEFKPDGFRIDTVKHVNIEFWQQFSPALMQHAKTQGIDNFFMFGEVYSFEPENLSRFTTEAKIPSVLDFAFQGAMTKSLVEQQGTDVLAQLFAKDHFYQTEHKDLGLKSMRNANANQLVNFTGNHDMGRFAYSLKQSPYNYNEQAQIQRNLLAHAMMFFSRGVPVIYYGDEQGFVGDGGDQASRQDMMPSLVGSYNDDDLLATDSTTADDNFDINHPLYQSFAKYSQLYQQYPALRFGEQSVVYSQDKPGVFAITRQMKATNSSKTQNLLVVFNTATDVKNLNVLTEQAKAKLLYRSDQAGKIDEISGLSFAIYQLK